MSDRLTNLEIELLKTEINGRCIYKVVAMSDAFIPCYRASCDGYGAYEVDGEVHFCPEYRRLKGKEE